MKKSLIILIIVILFSSCKKENREYINWESEILLGSDSLLYGIWESADNFQEINGADTTFSHMNLKIFSIGNYEKHIGDKLIEKGKLDTILKNGKLKDIIFCPDGIKLIQGGPLFGRSFIFGFDGPNKLYLYPSNCLDCWNTYYARIK